MNIEEIKRKLTASRTFSFEVEGKRFTGRYPEKMDQRLTMEAVGFKFEAYCFATVLGSITSWTGFTVQDFLPEEFSTDALDFDRGLLKQWLSERPEAVAAVFSHISADSTERVQVVEEATKN